ncbi:MAG: glycoside hydrolase/phage tail family protein [Parvularculaceae bacterium]|nr:glycoside hydrolase/phage tail family protein [Parvularculaceae bacterium]
MAQLILSAAGSVAANAGKAGLGTLLARTVASTASAYAAGVAERLIFGPRKRTVEGPRLDAFQIQSSTEGTGVPRVYGRARLSGQLIWAANFRETLAETTESSGGKGGRLSASKTTVREYLYSLSFAAGLCEGPIDRVARAWADGKPLDLSKFNVRVHRGTEDQTPDDLIAATEGAAPAFRGLAYVVFENLPLKDFGNRIPQLSFEVEKSLAASDPLALENALSAVTVIPGSGEFVYGTTRVTRDAGEGVTLPENANNNDGVTDFVASLNGLLAAAPNLEAASLIVSWFGDDLRAGQCTVRPGVETYDKATAPSLWRGGGLARGAARLVSQLGGRPAYGGTPDDKGVIEAILAMKAKGLAVMLHPFILMDIPPTNALPAPDGAATQPAYPWRGRIGAGALDRTAAAASAVAAFFGTAQGGDFTRAAGAVSYHGPHEWSFRRMILHYAHLTVLAGGVEAFLIGSELRDLLRIRDHQGSFVAVNAMRALAAEVRSVVGPGVKLSYGADWSEWQGLTAPDGKYFHLDPLWADNNINFIGVDQYAPLADWRDGFDHADRTAGFEGPHQRAYIAANIEGGENFDWYYASSADRDAQARTPITDFYGETFTWRAKDIRGFWENPHHDRPNWGRSASPSPWVPRSKPIRFTEIGVPAIDKGANAPNVFFDAKSSESQVPPYSSGARDDLAQRRALEAVHAYWRDPAKNPQSPLYAGPMIETDRLYVYAFDARPFPFFPARGDIWGDAENWERGHWLNGRLTRAPLDALITALGAPTGAVIDASALPGSLAGYVLDRPLSPRQAIDPLADLFQIDMIETETALRFTPRGRAAVAAISVAEFAETEDGGGPAFALQIAQQSDAPGAVRLSYIDEGGDYRPAVAEARLPYANEAREAAFDIAAAMDEASAAARVRSLLADAGVMRETVTFALPPSALALEPGDAVTLDLGPAAGSVVRDYRILSIEDGAVRRIEAVRVAPAVYEAPIASVGYRAPAILPAPGQPLFELMNLPLLREGDDAGAPYVGAFADPWPGAVALYRLSGAPALAATLPARAVMGRLDAALPPGFSGRLDRRALRLRLSFGALSSRSLDEVYAGANTLAVETDAGWEILQFATAGLGGDGVWTLSMLLRGQIGTEDAAAAGANAGARCVLITPAVEQPQFPLDLKGLALGWSGGPADDPVSAPTFRTKTFTGEARGLKPLAPAHLRARASAGAIALSWIRRTRIGGDSWTGEDAPLGEAYERYRVEVRRADNGNLVRTAETTASAWTYAEAEIAADFPAGKPPLTFTVAQLSDTVGPGCWAMVGG